MGFIGVLAVLILSGLIGYQISENISLVRESEAQERAERAERNLAEIEAHSWSEVEIELKGRW